MTENATTGRGKVYRFPKVGWLRKTLDGVGLGGVSAGLAYKLKIQTWIVRLAWVLSVFFFGWPVFIYILFWIFMPPAETPEDYDKVCK